MRSAVLVAMSTLLTGAAHAQARVVIRDAGPGPVGRQLRQILDRPGTQVIMRDTVTIPRDSVIGGSLVIIGSRGAVSGTVRGDVVMVGGDLFLRPASRIEGDAIAIGGGVHSTMLGLVQGSRASHREFTFDAEPNGGSIELRYREVFAHGNERPLQWPAFYGVRVPTYDRTNGLSVGFGPAFESRFGTVDLMAVYRSQLGQVDPQVRGRVPLGRKLWIDAFVGRETRTNDDWINGRLANSLHVLYSGRDERNWYRATGGWAKINRLFETTTMTATYSIGGTTEDASSARPMPGVTSGPWSFTDGSSARGMFRPNPLINSGRTSSGIAGAMYQWTATDVKARLDVDLEVPVTTPNDGRFVQMTVDGQIGFPTFRLQRYRLEVHGVMTAGDTAPAQRFAYIGGSSTLPTEEILVVGGDQLLFLENRYEVPLTQVILPFIGSPLLTFRHIVGGAGIQRLPDLTQIVGLRLSIPGVRVQALMNTESRKVKVSAGLSLSR